MSVQPVADIPQCVECRQMWLPRDTDHWLAYWIDDGPEDALIFYCPAFAKKEFGDKP